MPRPLSRDGEQSRRLRARPRCSSAWPATRLVHRIVEDLGRQVMQRRLIRAADIHARPAAHGLEPFQNLDVLGGVAGLARRPARGGGAATRGAPRRRARFAQIREQVGCVGLLGRFRGRLCCFSHCLSRADCPCGGSILIWRMSWSENRFPLFLDMRRAMRRDELIMTMPWTRRLRENKRRTMRYMDRLHGALARAYNRVGDATCRRRRGRGGGDTGAD